MTDWQDVAREFGEKNPASCGMWEKSVFGEIARLRTELATTSKGSLSVEKLQAQLAASEAARAGMKEAILEHLRVAKDESHQIMVALEPWIDGNPDRSKLHLAHFSACAFRAWGAVIRVKELLEADSAAPDALGRSE